MASNAESILKLVNSYAEEMYIPNSFTVYLEKMGKGLEDEGDRGRLDIDNSRIILNQQAIEGELFDEYAASIIAYFQIPAYLIESARAYERREDDEIRVSFGEMKKMVESSLILPGLCKYFELYVQTQLQNSHDYNFPEIEEDVMKIIVEESKLGKLTKEDYEEIEVDKTSLYELNRGFRIFEKLVEKTEKIDCPRKDELLRACLIAASESGNFDAEFRNFLSEYTIEDIFVKARLESVRIPLALLDLENLVNDGFQTMGRVRRLRVSDIRSNVEMVLDEAKRVGLSVKDIRGIDDIREKLVIYSNQEDVVSTEHQDDVREVYRGLGALIQQFKNKKPESITMR